MNLQFPGWAGDRQVTIVHVPACPSFERSSGLNSFPHRLLRCGLWAQFGKPADKKTSYKLAHVVRKLVFAARAQGVDSFLAWDATPSGFSRWLSIGTDECEHVMKMPMITRNLRTVQNICSHETGAAVRPLDVKMWACLFGDAAKAGDKYREFLECAADPASPRFAGASSQFEHARKECVRAGCAHPHPLNIIERCISSRPAAPAACPPSRPRC